MKNRTHWVEEKEIVVASFISDSTHGYTAIDHRDPTQTNWYYGYGFVQEGDNSLDGAPFQWGYGVPEIIPGAVYTVTYNGQTSRLTANEFDNGEPCVCLGNMSLLNYAFGWPTFEDNGLEYLLEIYPAQCGYFYVRGVGTSTVSIHCVETSVHQLDPKFIPTATNEEVYAMMLEEGALPIIQTEDGSVLTVAENEILMI